MITLTTDFGYKDPFAGMMKGVILSINPGVEIVDITHGIGPQDIMEAALVIGDSYRYFPAGAIHVVVVDPGVGSGRRPVLFEAADYFFIGPDNGVFGAIYEEHDVREVIHITTSHHFLHSPGSTFHGRDVFAPVAAWLSRGTNPENFGDGITDFLRLSIPVPETRKNGIKGEVLYIDHFGNAVTNISKDQIDVIKGNLTVKIKDEGLNLRGCYEEGGDGKPHALINSNGRVEIFIYKGDASAALGIKMGDSIDVVGIA